MKKLFGRLGVQRWPSGDTASLPVPNNIPKNAISNFHTHPNYGTGGLGDKGPSWFVRNGMESGDIPFARDYDRPGFIVDVESYIYYDGTGQWREVYKRR